MNSSCRLKREGGGGKPDRDQATSTSSLYGPDRPLLVLGIDLIMFGEVLTMLGKDIENAGMILMASPTVAPSIQRVGSRLQVLGKDCLERAQDILAGMYEPVEDVVSPSASIVAAPPVPGPPGPDVLDRPA